MTLRRKWLLRVGLTGVLAFAITGAWCWRHRADLKASYAARQLRNATTDEERNKAAERLVALGEPGLTRLVGFVRCGDESCRGAATGSLDHFLDNLPAGEQRAVTLAGQLLDEFPKCDPDAQRAILGLLPAVLRKTGNAHAQRCRQAVATGLKLPDPAARIRAVQIALHPDVKMRADLLPLLSANEAEVRRAALFAVASVTDGEQVIGDEDLFHWLHDPDETVRKVCHDALVSRDRSETEISLGRRLTDPDPLERLKLLLDLRYDDDVADPDPWLERLSRDPEPAVRAGAARIAVEVAVGRRLSCPGWVTRVADADADATVRRIATFFRRQPTGRADPNVRPIGGP
jgi:hypothetical protein